MPSRQWQTNKTAVRLTRSLEIAISPGRLLSSRIYSTLLAPQDPAADPSATFPNSLKRPPVSKPHYGQGTSVGCIAHAPIGTVVVLTKVCASPSPTMEAIRGTLRECITVYISKYLDSRYSWLRSSRSEADPLRREKEIDQSMLSSFCTLSV